MYSPADLTRVGFDKLHFHVQRRRNQPEI